MVFNTELRYTRVKEYFLVSWGGDSKGESAENVNTL